MPYSAVWSEAIPAGSLSASDIDQAIRDVRRDVRERMSTIFGMADWSADPLVAQFMAFGANPAQSGVLRAANNVVISAARNAANSADIVVSKVTAANLVELGNGAIQIDPATGFAKFTAINVQFVNNAALSWRNQAGTQDIFALSVDITDYVRVGVDSDAAGTIVGHSAKKLGFFGVNGLGIQVVTGAKGGNAALASLMAALGAAGYGLVTDTTT